MTELCDFIGVTIYLPVNSRQIVPIGTYQHVYFELKFEVNVFWQKQGWSDLFEHMSPFAKGVCITKEICI